MNLEIPPGRDKNAVIEKFKAKWYRREIVSIQMSASLRSETAAMLELSIVAASLPDSAELMPRFLCSCK